MTNQLNEAAAILAEFLKAGDKATPGPWTESEESLIQTLVFDSENIEVAECTDFYNAEFIALSRQVPDALRDLLRSVYRFVEPNLHQECYCEQLKMLHDIFSEDDWTAQCNSCAAKILEPMIYRLIEEEPKE